MLCLTVSSAYRSAIFVSAFPIAGLRSRDRFPGLSTLALIPSPHQRHANGFSFFIVTNPRAGLGEECEPG